MNFKYLIVGGGAAGVAAAAAIREKEPDAAIGIVSDETHPLYSRVMLSKPAFFLGKISFEAVWLKGKSWYDANRITFLGGRAAEKLDGAAREIRLADGAAVGYEKLLLAVGVRPNRLNAPGADKKGVYYLRTLEEGKAIMDAIKTTKSGVVVGGGFIGMEMAEILKLGGLKTTLVVREKYFWEPMLDEPSGKIIEQALQKGGVEVVRGRLVKEVRGSEAVSGVLLDDGTLVPADMVVCGVGAHADLDWLAGSGVKTARGILSDECLATNVPDVFTAGDVAEYQDGILDERLELGNWVNANEQGKVAALNMMGVKTPFRFVLHHAGLRHVGRVRRGREAGR